MATSTRFPARWGRRWCAVPLTTLPMLSGVCVSAALLTALSGCSTASPSSEGSLFGLIRPYRMEVVQGNVVTKEMVAQLRPGLSADQVRGLLGAPLLMDVFHANRWDYVFTIRRQGTAPQQRRVTVFFDNERVTRFEADDVPSEQEFVASIGATKPEPRKTPLQLNEEQLRAIALPPPSRLAAPSSAVAASGPARSYPPLETTR